MRYHLHRLDGLCGLRASSGYDDYSELKLLSLIAETCMKLITVLGGRDVGFGNRLPSQLRLFKTTSGSTLVDQRLESFPFSRSTSGLN
ncbi:MAG: hypothetical protein COA78_18250 [Blastopirellula sp.]|nr:MAG: hypothetical protein COA78_18250 [Blastopirellula sp.]